jgi:hypothetical protein
MGVMEQARRAGEIVKGWSPSKRRYAARVAGNRTEEEMSLNATSPTALNVHCPYCGHGHSTVCPMVKAYEYHPDGSVKRVEFKSASDYGPFVQLDVPTIS